MKKILFFFILTISFAGCAKKPWTKDSVVNECLGSFNKKNEKEKIFSGMQIPLLCDCMAEKLVAKYKSDAESSKDKEGVKKISRDCATEVISK